MGKYRWGKKFVLKGEGKRYCHENKTWALDSFIKRKQRQILINKRIIKIAENSLNIALKLLDIIKNKD